jgi:hypothetical protein
MKKMAGRDYEDLLQVRSTNLTCNNAPCLSKQCAIPVFEGLLPPPHNDIVLDTLFVLATWHAHAKLRLHTDTTLALFEQTTTILGASLRKFVRVTCTAFKTTELPQEEAARGRRTAARVAKKAANAMTSTVGKLQALHTRNPKEKVFSLSTFKLHALGDYVRNIRLFGTSDSYSTQIVRAVSRS